VPDPSSLDRPQPVRRRRPGGWINRYRWCLLATDLVVIAGMVFLSQVLRLDDDPDVAGVRGLSYTVFSCILIALWMLALTVNGGYDRKILGSGPREYHRIFNASLYLFAFLAIASYLGRLQIARSYLLIALPLGLVGVVAGRWVWRLLLREHRRAGSHLHNVLVIGSRRSAGELAARLRTAPDMGYRVAGLCIPMRSPDEQVVGGFPVAGDPSDVIAALERSGADTVAVSSSDQFGAEQVRKLGWQLEGSGIRLCLAPSLTDVAGPRIHIKPVAGLPLMHVEEPRFRGPKLIAKTSLDLVLAAVGLVALSPVLLSVAVAIKVSDPGPVFFRQERVGLGGRSFRVWKLRSMYTGAEKQLQEAKQAAGQHSSVFYKSADDARITPIGRFMRKTSIDELPQLFNVLAMQMSIVGPRPLVPGEGAEIGNFLERRMLVRPGITGLWQVSGRSDLSEQERIRLDFYYVENWSVAGDLVLIARTLRAVVKKQGAY
jgi:exopolysaccharide biosynthesis polyprenyl glycosylphosphotransferase